MEGFEKKAEEMVELVRSGQEELFNAAFHQGNVSDYIRTKVREGSFCEQIFDPFTVDGGTPGIQRIQDRDIWYYMEDVEVDAVAMEVDWRSESKPRFVDSKQFKIFMGKMESEEVKKPKIELESAGKLMDMIRQNSKEAIAELQDLHFMKAVRFAIEHDPGDLDARTLDVDWTNGADKEGLASALNIISRMRLKPYRWLHSDVFHNWLSTYETEVVGNKTERLITEGFEDDKLLGYHRMSTIKTDMEDPRYEYDHTNDYALDTKRFFDYIDGNNVYTNLYLMVHQDYLGRAMRYGTDTLWSKWEKDIFHWQMWRYWGFGFGDMRGLVRVRIKIQGS